MAIPGFRKRRSAGQVREEESKEESLRNSQPNAKKATRIRRSFIIIASFCYLVGWVFLILVEIGNTKGTKILGDIYFFKLDLANIMPTSVPNLTLTNSIARTLGLHDFYQVGLWDFCEGYDDTGITHCSKPVNLYWFNPVEILKSELFAGASIALPEQINEILLLIRIASNVMFGFFITGLVLDFVLMIISPVVIFSRWWSLPMAILSFIAALLVLAASIIATAMSLIFQYVATSQYELNIGASIGTRMFAFMWIAAAFTLVAFIIHAGLGCCCTSKRDFRTGRKGGKHFSETSTVTTNEDQRKRRAFRIPRLARRGAATPS